LTIILNTTGNPITREERIKINENWTRIISGLTDLQFQINALAGGEDVDDLIKSIKQAIDDALLAISKIETATDNANLATQDAINATNTALTKIAEIEVLIAESTKLNTESAKLNTEAKQNIAQMTTIITTGNQLISDLTALKADIQTAVIQAQVALEQVYGWGTSTPWSNVETYIKNNIVTHNGSTWQSLVNDNLNNEPSELSPHWILMAKRGSSNKLVAHADKLATTSIGQVVWDLPSDYNPVTDTIMFYFNTVYLRPSEYTITGDDVTGYKLNYTSPETAIADNNIDALIFKNIPVNDLGQIDGMDLVNGSITLDKLGQDVKDAIQAGGGGSVTIDIINDLTTGGATKALSAEQGKVLKGALDTHAGDAVIHITDDERYVWNRKLDAVYPNATGTRPNDLAQLISGDDYSMSKVSSNHADVQNAGETGIWWAITTEMGNSNSDFIQTAIRFGDNKPEIKVRNLSGYQGIGVWSPWSASQSLSDNHINDSTIHVLPADKTRWDSKMDSGFDLADGSFLQANTDNHVQLMVSLGKRSLKLVATDDVVQNAGETGKQWTVTTERAGADNRYIQTAVKVDGQISDIKTRHMISTSGVGRWSAWTPSTQELFQSVSNGKRLVASAITGKGVETASDATFQTMADNITAIKTSTSSGQSFIQKDFRREGAWRSPFNLKRDNTQFRFNIIEVYIPFKPYSILLRGEGTGSGGQKLQFTFGAIVKDVPLSGFENLEGTGMLSSEYYTGTTANGSSSQSINYVIRKGKDYETVTDWFLYIPSGEDTNFGNDKMIYNLTILGE